MRNCCDQVLPIVRDLFVTSEAKKELRCLGKVLGMGDLKGECRVPLVFYARLLANLDSVGMTYALNTLGIQKPDHVVFGPQPDSGMFSTFHCDI